MTNTESIFNKVFNDIATEHIYQSIASNQQDAAKRSLQPTVIVCLGGSGCEVGARLKKKLSDYYSGLRKDDGIDPLQMIQFLAIDTVEPRKIESEIIKEQFTIGSEYFFTGGFVPSEYLKYFPTDSLNWWDDPYPASTQTITNGASRVRQVGRLCLTYHSAQIENRISNNFSPPSGVFLLSAQTTRFAYFREGNPCFLIEVWLKGTLIKMSYNYFSAC